MTGGRESSPMATGPMGQFAPTPRSRERRKSTMKTQPVVDVWLSLEQVSQLLGLPWPTVLHWARSGDPRLPAYKVCDDTASKQGSYRFKKQDVDAFQAQEPAPIPAAA